jgi:hypothetical protein
MVRSAKIQLGPINRALAVTRSPGLLGCSDRQALLDGAVLAWTTIRRCSSTQETVGLGRRARNVAMDRRNSCGV